MTNWQKTFLLTLLITTPLLLKAQTGVDTLSRLLLALDDTLSIYQNNELLSKASLSGVKANSGEIQLDLNKNKGDWSDPYHIYTRGDTLTIRGIAEKALFLKATNGFDTIWISLNFYDDLPTFSADYQNQHRARVSFDIPRVYELVHIALSLTEQGKQQQDMLARHTYYGKQVSDHFMGFEQHPLIQNLNKKIAASSFDKVFKMLTQQSLPLTFQGKRIVQNGVYPIPYRINPWTGNLLRQLQDFADQAHYLEFVEEHKGYHQKLLHEQQQFIRLDTLWMWLEEQFPRQVDGFKILFSPMAVERSDHHFFTSSDYQEYVLLLNNPQSVLQKPSSNSAKEALLLKRAFDEILPFYQQPLIQKHKTSIQEKFRQRSSWLANGMDASPAEIFEAYITNAVFCLWAEQKYTASEARMIRQQIEKNMLDNGYIRFYVFSRQMISLFDEYRGQKSLSSLYEELLKQL